jgi:hypothetical protein
MKVAHLTQSTLNVVDVDLHIILEGTAHTQTNIPPTLQKKLNKCGDLYSACPALSGRSKS